ncbi:MAG: 2-oxoacid:acceptor oxidoreductase subunit alpha [Candidatus Peribacteraceae bacterium]|nr:2-oxoacid:acceptor oxidoreductase subunit alpha [Candidatus Peribacteraceae bacterium]
MQRVSLKIVGASGQGINSVGEVLAKGLKREGYCVFGYREYPSLIKGGHASYQLDISNESVRGSVRVVDVLLTLNHHGLQRNLDDVKEGGLLIHNVLSWKFSKEDEERLQKRRIKVVYLPVEALLQKMAAQPILGNVLLSAFLWAAFGRKIDALKAMVGERYAKKKHLLDLNMQCIDEGYRFVDPATGPVSVSLPPPDPQWRDHLLLTGSHAVGLGAVHAGVRFFAGYPMTPASPILSYIAEIQNKTGMAVKQAEDEITAAQLVSGAMHMGTRALTATSGGGFDLMTETLSLNGMIENPVVFIVAQRPGPATGLPTWTAQGDLFLAVHSGHGEYPRCVMALADSDDAFHLLPEAFNLAEEFQIPVLVLTDKHLGEALFCQVPYDQSKTQLRRGKLVTEPAALAALKASDRYDPSPADGVSPRWLPGAEAATYCAQGDEHDPDGTVDEGAENARLQMEKRMRKQETLKVRLPEPAYAGAEQPQVLLVSWGSTKPVIEDVLRDEALKGQRIGWLHYTYLWPLKTEKLAALARKAKKTVLVEGNHQGQLGKLLRQESGIEITDTILKYDGRPFFHDELVERLQSFFPAKGRRSVPRPTLA